jgi:transposase-like protein
VIAPFDATAVWIHQQQSKVLHIAHFVLSPEAQLIHRVKRSCKYLNNVVEQDYRRIKQRIRADARIQAIRDGVRDDPRHRVGSENQERNNSLTSNR